jgi:uncharacterized repeat protein (TIGR02059 family)
MGVRYKINPLLSAGLDISSDSVYDSVSGVATTGTISVNTNAFSETEPITQSGIIYFSLTGSSPYEKKYIVDGNGSGIYFDNDIIVNGATSASLRNHITFYVDTNGIKYADVKVSALGEVVVPTLSSAEIGTQASNNVILTFSEDLNISASPSTSAFTVTVNATPVSVSSVSMYFDLNKAKVKLVLASAVTAGQTVLVSYTQPTIFKLRDLAGNLVANFSGTNVTNNVGNRYCVDFAAASNFLDTANQPTLLGFGNGTYDNQFSISFVIKPAALTAQRFIISTNDTLYSYMIRIDAAGKIDCELFSGGAGGVFIKKLATSALTVSVWTHVTFTYTGNSAHSGMSIYINGALDASAVGSVTGSYVAMHALNATERFCIGGMTGGVGNYYTGKIDDITVWSKCLNATEVAEIYNGGKNYLVTESSVQAFVRANWRFEQSLADSGANGFTLTNYTPTYSTDQP